MPFSTTGSKTGIYAARKQVILTEKKRKFVCTTFHKTCLVFGLAMLLLFSGSLLLYRQGTDKIRRELIRSVENTGNYSSSILKNEFNRLQALQTVLNTNWDINKLSLFSGQYSTYALSEAMSNIKDKLWAVQSGSRFIESINVYIPDIDANITTYSTGKALQEQRDVYASLSSLKKDELFYKDGKLIYITESVYASWKNPEKPAFFIQTAFSNLSIGNFFSEQCDASETNMLLFCPGNGILLSETPVPAGTELYASLAGLPKEDSTGSRILQFSCESQRYTALCRQLYPAEVYLIQYLPESAIEKEMQPFYRMIWLLFSVLVAASLVFSLFLYTLVHKPLKRLVKAFHTIEEGNLNIQICPGGQGEFHYLYQAFDRMILRLQESIRQAYQQQMLAQKAELKQLQSQIDPHFLYNSFFILNKRIRAEDTEGALLLSGLMGSYFQYITRNGRDILPLEEELTHARSYCEIQRIRFRNRLQVEIAPLPDSMRSFPVPRLILQPVCENAVKYAAENRSGNTVFRMHYLLREGGYFDIIAEDTGENLTDAAIAAMQKKLEAQRPTEITGMINIHRRLRLRYGEGCGVFLSRSPLGGLRVVLRISVSEERKGGSEDVQASSGG